MQVIADPRHLIEYPEMAVPKTTVGVGLDGQPIDPSSLAVSLTCVAPAIPPGSTTITEHQMGLLMNFILRENGLPERSDHSAEDLFSQLQAQNALSE
ncbi:uncharacterized protein I206_107188 [Kwoniella pini CBS 10737]|uniref:Uncharacterized protein n=1 Tax=Kwoniella pini CBS 10737 TaxID=1296096 RepID=A0AAJ8MTV7_9TREE